MLRAIAAAKKKKNDKIDAQAAHRLPALRLPSRFGFMLTLDQPFDP
jgi:hypothetical protein